MQVFPRNNVLHTRIKYIYGKSRFYQTYTEKVTLFS